MVNEQDFQTHLKTIKPENWDRFFRLLLEIDTTTKFGEVKGGNKLEDDSIQMPYWSWSKIVDDFFDIFHDINLCVVFDWGKWTEGKNILNQKDFNFNKLDTFTLCKLLTTIVRADRFNDGFLVSCFENGIVPSIIKAIKQNESKESGNALQQIKSALFGVAIGDALGVPAEFKSRQTIAQNPVIDMIGYGTYNLPAGTWSDDSSLAFCLAEALTQEFNLNNIGQNFVKWYYENYWTPHGNVFDIGIATRQAISRLSKGEKPELAGGFDESDNGNGSLMRILPLLFYLLDKPINERYDITKAVSSITHGHIRSVIACFYYLEFARQLFLGKAKFDIYKNLQTEISNHLTSLAINSTEIAKFDRLLKGDIAKLDEDEIQSSGYVLHTLEASIWCLLTTENYNEAVLKAVNLGDDTDTTGAVTGGLAGLLYGIENIPNKWLQQLAKYNEIENLAERLADKIASH
jgi:ADP-ribosyl-[dinitrogen reductase] hydrolase